MNMNPITSIQGFAKDIVESITSFPARLREMDRDAEITEVAKAIGGHYAASTIDAMETYLTIASRVRRSDPGMRPEFRKEVTAALIAACDEEGVTPLLQPICADFGNPGFTKPYFNLKGRQLSERDLEVMGHALERAALEKAKKYFQSYPLEVSDDAAEKYSRKSVFAKSGKVAVYDPSLNGFTYREFHSGAMAHALLSKAAAMVPSWGEKQPRPLQKAA